MGFLKYLAFGLLSLQAVSAIGEPSQAQLEEDIEVPLTSPALAVKINVSFPESEIFGVKLVNGRKTQAVLSISNEETTAVTVRMVGGSLWTLPFGEQAPRIIRNLTLARPNVDIPAGEKESVSYVFSTELHPQDLQLNIAAVITDEKGAYYTLQAFNATVSVVEAPTSFFDPQIIFLYIVLAAAFAGTSYFIYNTWITTLFPQQTKRSRIPGKDGMRAKASSKGSKKVDPTDQIAVEGADGPAVTSSAQAYDESWIPAHHIQRPQAKRIKSGTASGVKVQRRA